MPLVQEQTQLQTPVEPGSAPPKPIDIATPATTAYAINEALKASANQSTVTTETQGIQTATIPGFPDLHALTVPNYLVADPNAPKIPNLGVTITDTSPFNPAQTMTDAMRPANLGPDVASTALNPTDQYLFRDPNTPASPPAEVLVPAPQPIQTVTSEIPAPISTPATPVQPSTFVDMSNSGIVASDALRVNPAQVMASMGVANLGREVAAPTAPAPITPATAEAVSAIPPAVAQPEAKTEILDTSEAPVLDFADTNKKMSEEPSSIPNEDYTSTFPNKTKEVQTDIEAQNTQSNDLVRQSLLNILKDKTLEEGMMFINEAIAHGGKDEGRIDISLEPVYLSVFEEFVRNSIQKLEEKNKST